MNFAESLAAARMRRIAHLQRKPFVPRSLIRKSSALRRHETTEWLSSLVAMQMVWRQLFSGVFSAFVAVALCVSAPAARAQLWLEPDFSNSTALGPANATGAVIWSHGRSVDSEDSATHTPPYMAELRQGGWDTFRFNRMRDSDTLANSSRGLADEVHKLKQRGYRQVALAGQSFGAFLSLIAADSSDEVDAVIVTAPAAYGSFSEFYDSWRYNATKLCPLYEEVRHARIMAFYFHGDDFDPGGRGDRTRTILTERQLPFVVVDQPPHLNSHWAAMTSQFAKLYGNCILGFLDAVRVNKGAQCRGDTFWAADTVKPDTVGVAATAARISLQAVGARGQRTAALDPERASSGKEER
jgi:dienelactone hydrolase